MQGLAPTLRYSEPPTNRAPGGAAFGVFLLATVALLIRPAEFVPPIEGLPLYEVLIVCSLLLSLPLLFEVLDPNRLTSQPITLFIIMVVGAVFLSHMVRMDVTAALDSAIVYAKACAYYLLVVALLRTPQRLRQYLSLVAVCVFVLTLLAVLQYQGIIDFAAMSPLMDRDNHEPWEEVSLLPRLRSVGIFNDPNDMASIIVVGLPIAVTQLLNPVLGTMRGVWIPVIGVLGYGLTLTHSRGGFIALVAAVLTLLQARFGWRRMLFLSLLAIPLLFLLFAGRQTELSTAEKTANERIELWSDGLQMVRDAPLFGIGAGNYSKRAGLVGHNSFLHAFAELGLFGGMCFLGAYALAISSVYRPGKLGEMFLDPVTARLRPCLLAIVVGYAVALLSLSRVETVPTYLVLGLAAAFARVAETDPPTPPLRFDVRLLVVTGLLSVAFLGAVYVFVLLAVR